MKGSTAALIHARHDGIHWHDNIHAAGDAAFMVCKLQDLLTHPTLPLTV